jgi:TonB family protein
MSTLSLDLRGVESTHALPREAPAKGASVSLLLHSAFVSTLVLIPLLQSTSPPEVAHAISMPLLRPITVTLPPAPLRIAAPPRGPSATRSTSAVVPVPSALRDIPTSLPANTGISLDPVPNVDGWTSDDPGPGGRIDDACPLGSICGPAAVPIADPAPTTVRIGGDIKEPRLIENRAPVYPPIAQSAGVAGRVVLEAHVGPDGRVREIRILESHTLFEAAALTSVRSRRYEPLRLNGVPTDFLVTITVAFNVRR